MAFIRVVQLLPIAGQEQEILINTDNIERVQPYRRDDGSPSKSIIKFVSGSEVECKELYETLRRVIGDAT